MRMVAVLCLVLAIAPVSAQPGQIWSVGGSSRLRHTQN